MGGFLCKNASSIESIEMALIKAVKVSQTWSHTNRERERERDLRSLLPTRNASKVDSPAALSSPGVDRPLTPRFSASQVKGSRHKQKIKHINTLLLKFPVMIEKIEKLKVYFVKADKAKNGSISPDEFLIYCDEIGVHLSKDTRTKLFEMTDFNDDKTIDFQEFVVVCALVYLLEENNKGSTIEVFADIYDMVIDAFLYFDKNNSGYLDKEEVLEGFSEGATPSAKVSKGLVGFSARRFEELDWDKNGKVSFGEFLFALEKWLGIDADDAADEMEDVDKEKTDFAEARPEE